MSTITGGWLSPRGVNNNSPKLVDLEWRVCGLHRQRYKTGNVRRSHARPGHRHSAVSGSRRRCHDVLPGRANFGFFLAVASGSFGTEDGQISCHHRRLVGAYSDGAPATRNRSDRVSRIIIRGNESRLIANRAEWPASIVVTLDPGVEVYRRRWSFELYIPDAARESCADKDVDYVVAV